MGDVIRMSQPLSLIYVPFSQLIIPATGECMVDHWWIVHPEKGAVFVPNRYNGALPPYPQANRDKRVTDQIIASMGHLYPDCCVAHVAIAYLSHAK